MKKNVLFTLNLCVLVAALGPAPAYAVEIVLSTLSEASLGGVERFGDGDLISYNPASNTAIKLFDEVSSFTGDEDIDAVHVLATGNLILSTKDTATLGGLTFKDGDLVLYDPNAATATLFFSEDLFSAGEDIDAFSILPNGNLLLSTEGDATLAGLSFRDGDLVEYDPNAATASLFFSEDLFSAGEDIDAVHVFDNGNLLLSTLSEAALAGLTFRDGDLVEYDPNAGTATLVFSEDRFSDGEDIDAVYDPVSVPEPSSSILFALGLAGLGLCQWRSRRTLHA